MQTPLIGAQDPAPVGALPSAPPLPELISDAELSTIKELLQAEACNGFVSQLRALRIRLYGRVIHQGHARILLEEFEAAHRAQALQELYERQLLIDSSAVGPGFLDALGEQGGMGLTAQEAGVLREQVQATAKQALQFLPEGQDFSSGFNLSALPSAPPAEWVLPQPSAPPAPSTVETRAVIVLHHDGGVATVVGDASRMDVLTVLSAACQHLKVPAFDPSRHYALLVWPGRRVLEDLSSPIAAQGVPAWARVLWLERPRSSAADGERPADPRTAGLRFGQVLSTFFALAQGGEAKISKGELRNFFWNLNLEDGAFAGLWHRVDTRDRGFLDIDDLLHLVGRAHMQYPTVPIDALLYEAAKIIMNKSKWELPSPVAAGHFDLPIAETPHGIGLCGACERHFGSYFFALILQVALPIIVVLLIYGDFDHPDSQQWMGIAAVATYVIYLVQSFICTRFSDAISNTVSGVNYICGLMEKPKGEHPHFTWRIQCYHYETRTRLQHYTDSEGKSRSRTVTERHRVNTWASSYSGVIPSIDRTPQFIPDTTALVTEIDTHLDLDFSQSNYLQCYRHWCLANRFDLHADESRSEDLPSRKEGFLAEWTAGARPIWVRQSAYVLASLCLCSMCFRLAAQSRSGAQDFTYRKVCFRIDYAPPLRCHHGAASVVGGLAVGLAIGAAMGHGGWIS